MYVKAGLELPDTPTMAIHRGRIDLLEEHSAARSGICFAGRFPSRKSIRPTWDATTRCWPRTARRSAARRFCTVCADYDETRNRAVAARSRHGCRCSGRDRCRRLRRPHRALRHRRVAAEFLDELPELATRSRRSPSYCWIAAPIRMREHRCASNCIPATGRNRLGANARISRRDADRLGPAVSRQGVRERAGDEVDRGARGSAVKQRLIGLEITTTQCEPARISFAEFSIHSRCSSVSGTGRPRAS